MKSKAKKICLIVSIASMALAYSTPLNAALACSRAQYSDGTYSVVARTMDILDDNVKVYGYPRGITLKSSDTEKGFEYVTKYASIQLSSMDDFAVTDALNEKGLHASFLYLEKSKFPEPSESKANLEFIRTVTWAVSSFATINELIEGIKDVNLIGEISQQQYDTFKTVDLAPPLVDDKLPHLPIHAAFTDASGDNLIIEMVDGQLKLYHGREHDVLTNDPDYPTHLFIVNDMKYQAHNTIASFDRFASAKQYLIDMKNRKVSGKDSIIFAMRGVIAKVHGGTDEIDPTINDIFPTIWSVLVDQTDKVYYLQRYNKWSAEIYDFKSFKTDSGKITQLKPRYLNN